jgi:uncharacterized protein YrrD
VADPVAWIMIEPGWIVRDADGKEIGRVQEVTGDENADIFDGLTIKQGILTKDKYVPSEHVAAIRQGEVVLDIPHEAVESLETFTEPAPEEQIVPESSTWYQRLAWWLTGRNR